jgi:hypothetical protein
MLVYLQLAPPARATRDFAQMHHVNTAAMLVHKGLFNINCTVYISNYSNTPLQ